MTLDRVRILVDGHEHAVEAGTLLVDALDGLGVTLPTLCHDPRLAPVGDCRGCDVELCLPGGEPAVVPACRTRVDAGQSVVTASEPLQRFRRELLSRLADRASVDDMSAFPDKALHRALRACSIAPCAPGPGPAPDASHPLIRVDMSRCIGCFRCVRICDEVQGQSVWHAVGRGADLRIVPDSGDALGRSSCVGCGACVDTCPTSALTDVRAPGAPQAQAWTRTTCAYCGVGCELEVGTASDRIVAVRPAQDAPVNRGHLCVKGRYATAYADSPERVTRPLVRRDGRWIEVDWDVALAAAADGLRRVRAAHGPDAVGVLGSARATNEENFLVQKFARIALGTNNVDCCARVCHTPSAVALKRLFGTGAATSSFIDIERAGLILVVGANPLECHPVVGARIRQRVRHGARLLVIDPRRTELAAIAEAHLAPRPGTDVALLNALAHVLIAEGLTDGDFLARRVERIDDYARSVADWTPERAATTCGVDADAIRAAARLYAGTRPALAFHGLGLTEHHQGTEGVMALCNLALLTGNVGRPGAGINPLRGQNNVQGAAIMGCNPDSLTGGAPIEAARERHEAVWGAPLPREPGLNLLRMMDAAAEGSLRALYAVGYDVLATLADTHATERALARLELVVVQDLFLNETARRFGHVFLPVVSSFEKDGTFMNSERRVQRVRRALAPRGDARSDAEATAALAAALGHAGAFAHPGPAAIWDEVRALWPAVAGMTWTRLESRGLQWPCHGESDPGTEVLHADRFAHGLRASLEPIQYLPTPEQTNAEFPFLLSTGRNLYAFNAGTMTSRSATHALRPTDTLDVAPDDARRLALSDGAPVRIESRYGSAVLPCRIARTVAPGRLFATFHDPRAQVNRVTGPVRDRLTDAPEYKVTAVRITRA